MPVALVQILDHLQLLFVALAKCNVEKKTFAVVKSVEYTHETQRWIKMAQDDLKPS